MAENAVLECLKRLQDVLKEKYDLDMLARELPAELVRREESLETISREVDELTETMNALEGEITSISIKYDDASRTRMEHERQVEFLSALREYEAMHRQIEEDKALETALIKSKRAKLSEADRVRSELQEKTDEKEIKIQLVEEEKLKISSELDGVKAKIVELEEESRRIKESGHISDELYNRFINIINMKNGIGAVPVYGQVCMGCNRVLPVQFVIDMRLKEEEGEVEFCPYCSRIIWYEKLDAELEKNYIFEQFDAARETSGGSESEIKSDYETFDDSMSDEKYEDF